MAVNFIDPNPAPGNQFGHSVVALSTGNVVITSPFDDAGGVNAGAVYLFNGTTGALISTLRGSGDFDQVGGSGVTALSNGNFVVSSANWHSGNNIVGAVTWGSGTTGVNGVVSAANSFIGSSAGDAVGSTSSVIPLPSGNYVMVTPSWDNGTTADVGAVTWVNGAVGLSGTISAANSLIGSIGNDRIGNNGVKVLANGNYVVTSSTWGGNRGAVTWVNGGVGLTGTVSSANSLVGSSSGDDLGSRGILELSNGNFVVMSPNWDNAGITNAGAATWVNGTTGLSGTLSAANSLVGSSVEDNVGGSSGTALNNGNYVVNVPLWNNSGINDAGAAVWGSGTSGAKGTISAANAIVGVRANDQVSVNGTVALTNGNYVVVSPNVDGPSAVDVGAVTWGNGTSGTAGSVSATNSLVGTATEDRVGVNGVVALTNGNYVVASGQWDLGTTINVGAVTWGNGGSGISGPVSSSNSFTGSRSGDLVGISGVYPLTNGNYVFASLVWKINATTSVGAVTWRNGSTGSSGVVSPSNSLVGSTAGDLVGDFSTIKPLANGNFVVLSSNWDNSGVANAGAVTWVNGTTGLTGPITAANSLVGTSVNDRLGNHGIVQLTNNHFVVISSLWDHGSVADAGAVTWVNGTTGRSGAVSASNSLVGSSVGDQVGLNGIVPLANGNYVVPTQLFDSAGQTDAGAVTWANGTTGIVGPITAPSVNHVKGTTAATSLQSISLDAANGNFYARFIAEGSGTVRVGSQSAGFDAPVGATLTAAFSGPNLTITDVDATGKDNQLTVKRVNISGVDYLEFTDAAEAFASAPITVPASSLTNGNRTLRVPLSAVGGSLTVNLLGGSDGLTVDLTGGDAVPAGGVFFNGGDPPSGPGDKLSILGGTQGNVTYNYTNASNGNVVMSNFGTVNYTGLELPLTNSGSAVDVTLALPTTANNATFADDGSAGNGLSRFAGNNSLATDLLNPAGSITINHGTASDTITFQALPDFTAGLTVGSTVFPFSAITFAGALGLAANNSLNAFSSGEITLSTSASDLTFAGTGAALLSTSRSIVLNSGASITTAAGNLTLEANRQTPATSGSFVGITLNDADLASATGAITVRGRGGNDASGGQTGVQLLGTATIGTGTTGVVTVQGTGGASSGNNNLGVQVLNIGSMITSGGGNVLVTGVGGGSGSSTGNAGVMVEGRGRITAGSAGTVTVTGSGSATSGANSGVVVTGFDSQITSGGGAVSVSGTGAGNTMLARGVSVMAGGVITATSAGNVTVNGMNSSTAGDSFGVYVAGISSAINSAGGHVSITGVGGGSGAAGKNNGVAIETNGTVSAGGLGNVTINGTGGNASGSGTFNHGVTINSSGRVNSSGGNVSITGVGTGSGTGSNNAGVSVSSGAIISAGGSGALTLTGTGGGGSGGLNHGVLIADSSTQVVVGNGGVSLVGTAGAGTTSLATTITTGALVNAFSIGTVSVIGDSFNIDSTASITAPLATVTIRPKTISRPVDLGDFGPATSLRVRDAHLDRISASLVQVGDAATGTITINSVLSPASNLALVTGADVNVNSPVTMGANLHFTTTAASTVRLPNSGSDITASGTGAINITTARDIVLSSGASINTVNGALSLSANQQATPTAGNFRGIEINGGLVRSTGTGAISLWGRGGVDVATDLYGVSVSGLGQISSSGNILVTGTGGGTGASQNNHGVVFAGGSINASGTGNVTIDGFGGNNTGTGGNNFGVLVDSTTPRILATSGAVTVTGRGGGVNSGSPNNIGVVVNNGGRIESFGQVSVSGFGGGLGGGGANNKGLQISGFVDGDTQVRLTGVGGGALGSTHGFGIELSGTVAATNVIIDGTGGNLTGSGGSNYGVTMFGEAGVTAEGGNLNITAAGGGGLTTGSNVGMLLTGIFAVRATGAGNVNISATGGSGSGGLNYGFHMGGNAAAIRTANGNVTITARAPDGQTVPARIFSGATVETTGTGSVNLNLNGLQLETNATIDAGSNQVTVKPTTSGTPVNLGAADVPGILSLTDAELDLITAGTLTIGDSATGAVTLSTAVTRPAATAVVVNSNSAIDFAGGSLNSAGGNVTLNPGTHVSPATTGVDVTTGAGTLSFTSGDDLLLNISGLTPDVQHQQLNVTGTVNLTGADLALVGSLIAVGGEVITIINNDGIDPVVGTFNGLAEGATIATDFLGSGFSATISYVGGDGNDVVVVLGNPPGTTDVGLVDGNLVITDVLGGNTDDALTISFVGGSIQIHDPNNVLSALPGVTPVNAHTVEVPFAAVTGNVQVNTLAGNDVLTLNFAGGNPLPMAGLVYAAGIGNADSLVLTAGTTTSVAHAVTNSSDGSVTLTGPLVGTIAYSGLEPITDGLVAADRVFTLNAGDETISLNDATGAFNLLNAAASRNITFANPTVSLTIDAAAGNDSININSIDADGPFAAAVTIHGGEGDDAVNLNADMNLAAGRHLDVDLQNDAATPGNDTISFGANANVALSGSGGAILRASQSISLAAGASLVTTDGNIVLEANQQATATAGDFVGVHLSGGVVQATAGGTVTVRGRGGDGGMDEAGLQFGVFLSDSGAIRGGTTGTVLVQGTGGASPANQNYGVRVFGDGSIISSLGANVQVIGTGGGTGATSGANRGVDVESTGPGVASITAGGNGNVVVQGTGSNTRLSPGVRVAGVGGMITSTTGNVQVTGQGGNGSFSFDAGVWVDRGGTITSGVGGGSVTVTGVGGNGPNGTNHGVVLQSAIPTTAKITSGGGPVQVLGQAGNGADGGNFGVFVGGGGEIIAPMLNPVTINGTAGLGAAGGNIGVAILGRLNSPGPNITVIGTGGDGPTSPGIGIDQANVSLAGTGVLRLEAIATSPSNVAFLVGFPTTTTAISHTGTGGIDVIANTVHIESTATITASLGTVSFAPHTAGRALNLGSTVDTTANTLELSDAELDRITTGLLELGNTLTGPVTISGAITRAGATAINVNTAGAIQFAGGALSSGGGNVLLNAGTTITPGTAGLDVGPGAAGILRFGIGDQLTLNLGGPTVDSQYQQLNVAGQVDLTGLQLVLSGPLPQINEGFVIVANDSTDPVIGTFDGIPEGTMVDVNGLAKRLTYVGGDGNDVVLLPGNVPPTIAVIDDITLNEDAPQQTVNLSNITAGLETQLLMVTATSSVPALIPNPAVTYSSPNTTGSLAFTPAADANGETTITVIVRDAGDDGLFHTADDAVTNRSFLVTVMAINDQPTFSDQGNVGVVFNGGPQTVAGWATAISKGAANESAQALAFIVTGNTNEALFETPPAISPSGTLTYTAAANVSGSATITVVAQDSGGTALGGVDTSIVHTFTITVGPEFSLRVESMTPTPTGAIIEFNRAFDPTLLNMYNTQTGGQGPADVVLTRAGAAQPIRGSLILDSTLTKATFVATSGALPPDDYTLTVRSTANGFVDEALSPLDGNLDNIPGDDYVANFTVEPNPDAVVVSIPNFARGPQNSVNLPASVATGIPVSFSDGGGLLSASFRIRFDPALLDITDATVAPGMPAGTFVTAFSFTPGVLEVIFTSESPLPAGTTRFIDLQANVPTTAPLRSKHVIDITDISLSDGVPAIDDDAVAVVAYFGDTSGNGTLSGQDAFHLSRLAVNLDLGLAAFELLDPLIVADITGNNAFSALDTSRLLQSVVAVNIPEIPQIPNGLSLIEGGPDPKLSISKSLTAAPGDTVTIPVNIDSIVDLTGTGLQSGDLVLYYDPTVLNVTSVRLGSLLADAGDWQIASRIDPLYGRIFVSVAGSEAIEGVFNGEFIKINATVQANAPAGASAINLAASSQNPAKATQLNEGWLTLIPRPTDAANDPTDGLITIAATPTNVSAPTAQIVNDRLVVSGTDGDDFVLIKANSSGTQVIVRVNNQLLGTFAIPAGIAIDAFTGSDYVYVDDSLPNTVIATADSDAEAGIPADIIIAGANSRQVHSPLPSEPPAGGAGEFIPPSAGTPPSPHDLALLELLQQWIDDSDDESLPAGNGRRR